MSNECDCEKCVAMCRRFPCRPLPEEVADMPDDVQARLMVNAGSGLNDVPHMQPAVRGYEGEDGTYNFDFFITIGNPGQCTFLDDAGRCELHGHCKPYEGRTSSCGKDSNDFDIDHLRAAWDTDEGRAAIADWRNRQKNRSR